MKGDPNAYRAVREVIKVYSSPDPLLANTLKSVLDSCGIACEVKERLSEAHDGTLVLGLKVPTLIMGKVPMAELWVLDDAMAEVARNIIAQADKMDQPIQPAWTCDNCGELIEEQFDQCWQCGNSRE